jgi:hypothetical protein
VTLCPHFTHATFILRRPSCVPFERSSLYSDVYPLRFEVVTTKNQIRRLRMLDAYCGRYLITFEYKYFFHFQVGETLSNMETEAVRSSETSVNFYHIPKHSRDFIHVFIVAYLLPARAVEPQKPRNTVHYATINEVVFPPCRAEPRRAFLGDSSKHAKQMQEQH